MCEDQDLTAVYILGFEKGKDSCAATKWCYDLDAAPCDIELLVLFAGEYWCVRWKDKDGLWKSDDFEPKEDPIAWAHVNMPKEKEYD